MSVLNDSDKHIMEMYFSNALNEIRDGCPKEIILETLEYYEESELYLACAGIKKALDWYDTNKFTKTMFKINEILEDNDLDELNYGQ